MSPGLSGDDSVIRKSGPPPILTPCSAAIRPGVVSARSGQTIVNYQGIQSHALRAGEVRPLCAPRTPELTWHLAAVGHRADRRHLYGQADGRRAGRLRAVRQRRALGTHARRHARGAGTWPLDVPGAARVPERVMGFPPAATSSRLSMRRRSITHRPCSMAAWSCPDRASETTLISRCEASSAATSAGDR